jgi:hypothetical protein
MDGSGNNNVGRLLTEANVLEITGTTRNRLAQTERLTASSTSRDLHLSNAMGCVQVLTQVACTTSMKA